MEYALKLLARDDAPARLFEIPQPPKQLWARGTLPNPDTPWLAVVGSRRYSSYGKEVCEHLIGGLRGTPITVVSGLALGIDAIAHRAALDAKLSCVAVPGSGLNWDVLYPKTNHSLARSILESGGALFSEYAPETHAAPWTFPERNRIMVGLSHAVLIIEASERSGTLITARLAGEYNRDLLAVPGSIFSEGSKGAHQFIKLGATPITTSDDILEALHIEKSAVDAPHDLTLSVDEAALIAHLHEPTPRDTLIAKLGKPAHETLILIAQMELAGLIHDERGVIRRAH